MTVVHVVLVKFKAEVGEAMKQELCNKVVSLKDVIPGIIKASAGKNFSDRSKGFEWGWVFEHTSKKDLDDYAVHPAHQEFVKLLGNYRTDILAFDYEI
ncbi:hypothetical protein INT43_001615 [Umbelopsis isabellina]|uniref:Stress-response A/B barrel domain-containing protein n=1 Tax=Mortierella isabellina TaxID=91625 RepID=A0A8H7PQT9_MORIS|nr:hypothetical protein INT43_001615 [Umbelopsis isabellina]